MFISMTLILAAIYHPRCFVTFSWISMTLVLKANYHPMCWHFEVNSYIIHFHDNIPKRLFCYFSGVFL